MDNSSGYSSIEEFISNKLMNFVREIIASRSISPIIFSEKEINEIIELINKSEEDNSSASKSNIRVEIINGKIQLHVSNSVFKLVPLNFVVETRAGISNNNLVLWIDKIKTGFVSIPITSGIKSFKEFSSEYITIDEENKCIILNNPLPENIKLKSININGKNFEMFIGISIKSKEDLLKIVEIFPEDLKDQIKASGIEKLNDVGNSILSSVANFIMKQKNEDMH
ncbi:hypothetical protein psyc5s11_24530 [Clostridium gelidum]|uniref:Uncharacterized protein n=1 Tax=Clostridium gelidum TaxID=704125 RepID=A0ABM7T3A9_9CLOT|nr:hypothetical protein [Clostridium gelidum]BCZ46386.1 hypothetical protein psyc5s11_24530 [Clostridium gelidum]